MSQLEPQELAALLPAETSCYPAPIPTQFVSSDEFLPDPQTENQKRVEARIKQLGSARRAGTHEHALRLCRERQDGELKPVIGATKPAGDRTFRDCFVAPKCAPRNDISQVIARRR